jgi:hypothetical protein
MAQPLIIQWSLDSYSGFGIYGLNLALNWAADASLEATYSSPINLDRIYIDPLRRQSLVQIIARSFRLQHEFERFANQVIAVNVPVLVALGNGAILNRAAHNVVPFKTLVSRHFGTSSDSLDIIAGAPGMDVHQARDLALLFTPCQSQQLSVRATLDFAAKSAKCSSAGQRGCTRLMVRRSVPD